MKLSTVRPYCHQATGLLLILSSCATAQPQAITELPLEPASNNQWLLPAGEYSGQFIIARPMHLRCAAGAVFDAQGQGNALEIAAAGVTLEGCSIRNTGRNLTEMDAGIFIRPDADGTLVRGNRIDSAGFGIFSDAASNVRILDNRIRGDDSVRSQDRGNGIHLFQATGALVSGNEVSHTRDGIYIDNSNRNVLENNTLHDLRYGVHYMYSQNNQLLNNRTYRTRTGYALMQSRMLTVVGNRSREDQGYGILMNNITYSTLENNLVTDIRAATTDAGGEIRGNQGKALFIYNSLFNAIENNHFQNSTLGIHLTAGSEDNRISGNAFVGNQQQVKYVATRTQEWSVDGRGNYWSDYLGWDRDDDGLGDIAYEPNDNIDRLLWLYPQVRLLLNSPSIEVLRWVQRAFPVIKSPGVQDSHPLMKLPTEVLEAGPRVNITQELSS
ncbi:nitrous oxide reductase family maturation protein NosD [Pseudomonas sp. sp1636]|uniref:nitrous oxide reductase family maturation protein NosD n=1 Tax=Pseudomonas sp. sp1636 TaxID=3036707 RepID=UPI0025A68B9E|nr:nitrous oxide reductase family maturation protein NosD [Pseudomonas sp. sp1636]MDM8347926.1 nitrous oxide reductase family maturation protein NosD [Pseudomonas sp. sp1636]